MKLKRFRLRKIGFNIQKAQTEIKKMYTSDLKNWKFLQRQTPELEILRNAKSRRISNLSKEEWLFSSF